MCVDEKEKEALESRLTVLDLEILNAWLVLPHVPLFIYDRETRQGIRCLVINHFYTASP